MPVLLLCKVKCWTKEMRYVAYFYLETLFEKLGSVISKFLHQRCSCGSHEQTPAFDICVSGERE